MYENTGSYYIKNGRMCPSSGYIQKNYTDRIYELVRVIDRKPLFLDDHYHRFSTSAAIIGRALPLDGSKMREDIKELVSVNKMPNNNVMVIAYYNGPETWYIMYMRKSRYPLEQAYTDGVVTKTFKWQRKLPNAKILNLRYRDALAAELAAGDVSELILIDDDEMVREGGKSNVFFYKDGCFFTPPSDVVLNGITRKHVIELIKRSEIRLEEKLIRRDEMDCFQEAFLTGTSIGVLPIRSIDDIRYRVGHDSVVSRLRFDYEELIREEIDKEEDPKCI